MRIILDKLACNLESAGHELFWRCRFSFAAQISKGDSKQGHSPCTIVTAYLDTPSKHDGKYFDWFKNTLRINAPMVVFIDGKHIPRIKTIRRDCPTHFVTLKKEDLSTAGLLDKFPTDPEHVPSRLLAGIWHEKINFLKKTKSINPFSTDYFAWMDAGNAPYREVQPPTSKWPDLRKLFGLPKDRLIVSASNGFFRKSRIHSSAEYHNIAGTSFLVHKDFIDEFHSWYYSSLDELLAKHPGKTICSSDQCLMTHMFYEKPEKFYFIGNGYGRVISALFP